MVNSDHSRESTLIGASGLNRRQRAQYGRQGDVLATGRKVPQEDGELGSDTDTLSKEEQDEHCKINLLSKTLTLH